MQCWFNTVIVQWMHAKTWMTLFWLDDLDFWQTMPQQLHRSLNRGYNNTSSTMSEIFCAMWQFGGGDCMQIYVFTSFFVENHPGKLYDCNDHRQKKNHNFLVAKSCFNDKAVLLPVRKENDANKRNDEMRPIGFGQYLVHVQTFHTMQATIFHIYWGICNIVSVGKIEAEANLGTALMNPYLFGLVH